MIYLYYCKHCDKHDELLRRVEDRDNPAICPFCGEKMVRQVKLGGFKIDNPFFSYQAGCEVKNKADEESKLRELDAKSHE